MQGRFFFMCVVLVLLVQIGTAGATTFDSSSPLASSNQVVLILAPYLLWDDIDPFRTPHTDAFIRRSAIGNLNARSLARVAGQRPSVVEGAMALGAGAWVAIDPDAKQAYDVLEVVEGHRAYRIYERFASHSLDDEHIVYLGLPQMLAAHADGDFSAPPGLLGTSIQKAGGVTAAIGNSDLSLGNIAERRMRPAALVAMDTEGRVRLGSVGTHVLEEDPRAAYGIRTDIDRFVDRMQAVADAIEDDTPSLIVLDPGDLYRVGRWRIENAPDDADEYWQQALDTFDSIVMHAQDVYPDAILMIAGLIPTQPITLRGSFAPIIVEQTAFADPLVHGSRQDASMLLSSDATRRSGLVTTLDVTATIYDLLGIDASHQVVGSSMYARQIEGDRQGQLIKIRNTAVAIDALRGSASMLLITATTVTMGLGAALVLLIRKRATGRLVQYACRILRGAFLACLSIPAAGLLMFAFNRWPQAPDAVTVQFVLAVGVILLLAIAANHCAGKNAGIIFIGALTSLAIIVDQLFGALFSYTGLFSYSPLIGFRFYGLGNEGAALLFAAAVIAYVLWLDRVDRAGRFTGSILIAGSILITLICAAPWWGANVGAAIWATVGFAFLWLFVNERKVSFKHLAVMGGAVVGLVAALMVIDRFGSGGQTHLARMLGAAEQGGVDTVIELVIRKARTNLRILMASRWTALFLGIFGYLTWVRIKPSARVRSLFEDNPFFAGGMSAILIAAVTAYFSEDSGIVLPMMMLLYLGSTFIWLLLGAACENPCAETEAEAEADILRETKRGIPDE